MIGYNFKWALDAISSGTEQWLSKQHPHSRVYICTVEPDDGDSMFLNNARNKFGLNKRLQSADETCQDLSSNGTGKAAIYARLEP